MRLSRNKTVHSPTVETARTAARHTTSSSKLSAHRTSPIAPLSSKASRSTVCPRESAAGDAGNKGEGELRPSPQPASSTLRARARAPPSPYLRVMPLGAVPALLPAVADPKVFDCPVRRVDELRGGRGALSAATVRAHALLSLPLTQIEFCCARVLEVSDAFLYSQPRPGVGSVPRPGLAASASSSPLPAAFAIHATSPRS